MSKLIAAMVVLWLIYTIVLTPMHEGRGGINSTKLNGALSASATSMTVDNTTGFLSADVLIVGDEEVSYTGLTATSFTGLTRGFNNTVASSHPDNSQVYSPDAGNFNRMLGFNVGTTSSTTGGFTVMVMTFNFISKALPNLILWDFPFFTGLLVPIRLLHMGVSIGLVIILGIQFLTGAQGILLRS